MTIVNGCNNKKRSWPASISVVILLLTSYTSGDEKYGLILADIGSNLYISGAPDSRWKNDDLRKLGQLHGSDFEVVKFNN